MSETIKLTANQKGALLQELLSFLLSMNGKAKKSDVFEHFQNKSTDLRFKLQKDEYIEQIDYLSSMCVRAEWLTKAGFWKVTEYGKKAYERFSLPKDLFQEQVMQATLRNVTSSEKEKRNSKMRFLALLLIFSPCTILGFMSNSQHLLFLAVFSLIVLMFSLVLYDARTKSIILGRLLGVEFLILVATLYLDAIFVTTSLVKYYYVYFLATLVIQVVCIMLVFLFPYFFSKVFEYINRSKWLIIIPTLLLILAFGGRYGRGGLLKAFYGDNIATIGFTTVFAVLMGVGLIYILGGMISGLVRAGYYD